MEYWRSVTLPQAYTREEEEKIRKVLLADGVLRHRRQMILHNLRLVAWIVRQDYPDAADPEELWAVGILGLIKGVHRLEPEKSTRLSSYLGVCIQNEIRMHLRRERKRILLDHKLLEQQRYLEDPQIEYGAAVQEAEIQELYDALQSLSEPDRRLIALRFGLGAVEGGCTQKEAAAVLGISQSYLSRRERKILRTLRVLMEGE